MQNKCITCISFAIVLFMKSSIVHSLSQYKQNTPVAMVQSSNCGYSNLNGIGSRHESNSRDHLMFGEFPWIVLVLKIINLTIYLYECGGSLITPSVILTAAHCVHGLTIDLLQIRAGDWNTQNWKEYKPHQDRYVHEIIVHEEFNRNLLHNDIALLILERPFLLDYHIQPICLPEPNAKFDRSRCYATGWGKNKIDGHYQDIPKKIDLPIMPRDLCQQNLRTLTRLGNSFELHDSFICAGGERGQDTCVGDDGSPLVCPIEGSPHRFYQVGIESGGVGCGDENIPGIYANVAFLRPWINMILNSKGIFL